MTKIPLILSEGLSSALYSAGETASLLHKLHQKVQYDCRKYDQRTACKYYLPWGCEPIAYGKHGDGDHQRILRVLVQEEKRPEIVVPSCDHRKGCPGSECWFDDRAHDTPEDTELTASINARCLDKLIRNILYVLREIEDTHCSSDSRYHKRPQAVYQIHLPHDDEKRDRTSFCAYRHCRDNECKKLCPARETVFCERKPCKRAEEERCYRSQDCRESAVEKVCPHWYELEEPSEVGKRRMLDGQCREPGYLLTNGLDRYEAREKLAYFLQEANANNVKRVRVIHGFGTGVVRNEVIDYLKKCSLVESFSFANQFEGGYGATIVILK